MLQALRNAGLGVMGAELAAVPLLEEVAAHVFYGQDAVNFRSKFGTVLGGLMLLDVIEHVADPVEFLTRLLNRLPNVRGGDPQLQLCAAFAGAWFDFRAL